MTRIAFVSEIALAVTGVALIIAGWRKWHKADALYDLKWSAENAENPGAPVKISAEEHSKRVYLGCSGIVTGALFLVISAWPMLVRMNRKLACRR